MESGLTHFGRIGPFDIFPEAYVFHVINKQTFEKKTFKFANFDQIKLEYLNMDIISVKRLRLNGYWRTKSNYYNNFCSLEIEIIG